MRKFNKFVAGILLLTIIFNFNLLLQEIEDYCTPKVIATAHMEPIVGIPANEHLRAELGVIEFTTREETTTQKAETTTAAPDATKSMTSAPTAQQTKYEEDEYGRYYWLSASCTAYCGCSKCCGSYAANRNYDEEGNQIILTASGRRAIAKYSLAMDKKYKFGTKVYIEGVGICEVMDRGGAVKGNVIDIYFDTHEEALNWGRRSIKVKVYVDG